jgi:hypothetical protein
MTPFELSPVSPNMLDGDKVIQFRCHKDVGAGMPAAPTSTSP